MMYSRNRVIPPVKPRVVIAPHPISVALKIVDKQPPSPGFVDVEIYRYCFPVSGYISAICVYLESMEEGDVVTLIMEVTVGVVVTTVEYPLASGKNSISDSVPVEAHSTTKMFLCIDKDYTDLWMSALYSEKQ